MPRVVDIGRPRIGVTGPERRGRIARSLTGMLLRRAGADVRMLRPSDASSIPPLEVGSSSGQQQAKAPTG